MFRYYFPTVAFVKEEILQIPLLTGLKTLSFEMIFAVSSYRLHPLKTPITYSNIWQVLFGYNQDFIKIASVILVTFTLFGVATSPNCPSLI